MIATGSIISIFILFSLALLALNIITSVWAYRDAVYLGRSQEFALIVLFGTLFFPIVGLFIYIVIRKDHR